VHGDVASDRAVAEFIRASFFALLYHRGHTDEHVGHTEQYAAKHENARTGVAAVTEVFAVSYHLPFHPPCSSRSSNQ
jgi:hypothetical protein